MALRIVSKLSLRSIRGNILLCLDHSASTFKKTSTPKKVTAIKPKVSFQYKALSIITYFNCVNFMNTKKFRRVFTL